MHSIYCSVCLIRAALALCDYSLWPQEAGTLLYIVVNKKEMGPTTATIVGQEAAAAATDDDVVQWHTGQLVTNNK